MSTSELASFVCEQLTLSSQISLHNMYVYALSGIENFQGCSERHVFATAIYSIYPLRSLSLFSFPND